MCVFIQSQCKIYVKRSCFVFTLEKRKEKTEKDFASFICCCCLTKKRKKTLTLNHFLHDFINITLNPRLDFSSFLSPIISS